MKHFFIAISALLISALMWAQSPQKMSYQAVVRDNSSTLITEQGIGIQVSIVQGTVDGTIVYLETHAPTTNENGLVSIEIGNGTTSDDFSAIDWSNGPYFIKTEIDPTSLGGTSYTITGINQLLGVPYAYFATTAGNVFSGDYNDLQNLPDFTGWDTNEADDFSGSYNDLTDIPVNMDTDATDDFSGDYNDLANQPDFTNWDTDVTDDFDGNYSNLSNTPDFTGWDTNDADDFSGSYNDLTDVPVNIDIDATDDFSGNYSDLLGTPTNLSDFTNDQGFITGYTETDPVYSGSQAYNIDAGDITNLGNLSGVNSGDQDISGIAVNTQAIQDTAAQIRSHMPTVKTYSVGEYALGGIVFYVDYSGQHGLVCALSDQDGGSGIQWYNYSTTDTEAHGDGVYAGEMNTMLIIANQGSNLTHYAAGICSVFAVTTAYGKYGDWYLPSAHELWLMYQNKAIIDAAAIANGGSAFIEGFYWSSSEFNTTNAKYQYFGTDIHYNDDKYELYRVRPIRSF